MFSMDLDSIREHFYICELRETYFGKEIIQFTITGKSRN